MGLAGVPELRAGRPLVVVGAAAAETPHQGVAARPVLTWVRAARVLLDLRGDGSKVRGVSSPAARCVPQPSGRHLAGGSGEARQTLAHKAIQQRVAAAAVAARRASAAVPLELAVATHKARRTDALVPSRRVLKKENLKLI